MNKKMKFSISRFKCQCCGNYFPLPRMKNRKREKNHIKDLWCPYCKCITKTKEIRDFDCYKNYYGEII